MAKLIYDAFTSLDGYVADENGNFDWAELDEEIFAFINNREKQIGTYLIGRKMYEMMAVWETPDVIPHLSAAMLEFAPIWQAAEKIVYSRTLQAISAAKTRLERTFEAEGVRELKAGRPATSRWAVRRSQHMPSELALSTNITSLIAPIIAGSGNPDLPGKVRVKLALLDKRRFDNGLVHVRYRAKN
jgi:dihydrofolate reductase